MRNQDLHADLIGLKATLFKAAQFLYNPDGTPYLDRVVTTAKQIDNPYATLIPIEQPRLTIDDALADYSAGEDEAVRIRDACQTDDFKAFLAKNGIKALSKFHNGTTAKTFLGWIDDNTVTVLRIPAPSALRPDSFDVRRLNTPLMAQPIDTYRVGNNTVELLPFVHVLPNIGLNAVDSLPGHTTIEFGKLVFAGPGAEKIGFDAHEEFGLDREMITFTALARVAGYKMEMPRDLAVMPNGSPLFVDPGTFGTMTPHMQELAFAKLNGALKELDLDGLFYWQQAERVARAPQPRDEAQLTM